MVMKVNLTGTFNVTRLPSLISRNRMRASSSLCPPRRGDLAMPTGALLHSEVGSDRLYQNLVHELDGDGIRANAILRKDYQFALGMEASEVVGHGAEMTCLPRRQPYYHGAASVMEGSGSV